MLPALRRWPAWVLRGAVGALMATKHISDCRCEHGDNQRLAWAKVNLEMDRGESPAFRAAWAEWWRLVEVRLAKSEYL